MVGSFAIPKFTDAGYVMGMVDDRSGMHEETCMRKSVHVSWQRKTYAVWVWDGGQKSWPDRLHADFQAHGSP